MRQFLRLLGISVFAMGVATPLAAQVASDDSSPTSQFSLAALDERPSVMPTPTTVDASTSYLSATGEQGQQPKEQELPVATPPHTGVRALVRAIGQDVVHIPTRGNFFVAAAGGLASAALHPIDDTTNSNLSGATFNKIFKAGALLGQSYVLLPSALTVYTVGRVSHNSRVSHIGSDLIESLAIAEMMTETLKYTVRRERPDGSSRNSFPSGHAAGTMAFATTLERHFGWKLYLPAYALATYVATSRLHDNRHYVSDVAFGSAVGIIAGRTVTRHGRQSFPVQAMAVPGGAAIVYSR